MVTVLPGTRINRHFVLLAVLFYVAAGTPLQQALAAIGVPTRGFLAVLVCAVLLTNRLPLLLTGAVARQEPGRASA